MNPNDLKKGTISSVSFAMTGTIAAGDCRGFLTPVDLATMANIKSLYIMSTTLLTLCEDSVSFAIIPNYEMIVMMNYEQVSSGMPDYIIDPILAQNNFFIPKGFSCHNGVIINPQAVGSLNLAGSCRIPAIVANDCNINAYLTISYIGVQ